MSSKTFRKNGCTYKQTIEEIWTGTKMKFYLLKAADPTNFWGYTEYSDEDGKIILTECFLGARKNLPIFREYSSGQFKTFEKVEA